MPTPEQVLQESLDAVSTILSFSISHSAEESNQELADFLRRMLVQSDPDSVRTAVYRAALVQVETQAKSFPHR